MIISTNTILSQKTSENTLKILKFLENIFVWSTNQPISAKILPVWRIRRALLLYGCYWITGKVYRHEHDADASLGNWAQRIFQSITQCHLFEFIFSRFITLISLYFTLGVDMVMVYWFWSFGSWVFLQVWGFLLVFWWI